jgi:L-amino acid N-acyltransferase YncA
MITYTTASSDEDLRKILDLQNGNLHTTLTEAYRKDQGFVTVQHRFQDLKKMNDAEQSIVAKNDEKIVAYILAMTRLSKNDIPVLVPMFEMFDEIQYLDKLVATYNYLVVGQVCVDEAYRGKGIFDNCYTAYKNRFQAKYDFAITEIAAKNSRSLHAHQRIGFKEIHKYIAPDGVEWIIVLWDWKH